MYGHEHTQEKNQQHYLENGDYHMPKLEEF